MKLGHNNHILHVLLIDFPKASSNRKGRVSSIIYDDIIDTTVLIDTIDKFCGPFLIVRIIYMLPFLKIFKSTNVSLLCKATALGIFTKEV